MVNIKSTISFDEYNAIVNMVTEGCFPEDTYSPVYYELMFRYALFKSFVPEYNIPELNETNYNEVWDRLTNRDGNNIYESLRDTRIYYDLQCTIKNNIEYRIRILASSTMSMSDMALATLFDTINEKVSQIDTSIFAKDDIETITQAVNATKDNQFAESLVNTMLDKGIIRKSSERVEE